MLALGPFLADTAAVPLLGAARRAARAPSAPFLALLLRPSITAAVPVAAPTPAAPACTDSSSGVCSRSATLPLLAGGAQHPGLWTRAEVHMFTRELAAMWAPRLDATL